MLLSRGLDYLWLNERTWACETVNEDRGGSRIFFRRGCTRLLLYFNTNKPHSFFCRIPVVLENCRSCQRRGGGAHPLHPPPRSAPGREHFRMRWRSLYKLADERRVKPDTSGRVNSIWIRYVWSGHKRVQLVCVILLHEKFLQFDWLTAVVFQLNLKYLHVKITNLLRVVGINTTRDISKLSQISLA